MPSRFPSLDDHQELFFSMAHFRIASFFFHHRLWTATTTKVPSYFDLKQMARPNSQAHQRPIGPSGSRSWSLSPLSNNRPFTQFPAHHFSSLLFTCPRNSLAGDSRCQWPLYPIPAFLSRHPSQTLPLSLFPTSSHTQFFNGAL